MIKVSRPKCAPVRVLSASELTPGVLYEVVGPVRARGGIALAIEGGQPVMLKCGPNAPGGDRTSPGVIRNDMFRYRVAGAGVVVTIQNEVEPC